LDDISCYVRCAADQCRQTHLSRACGARRKG
jgi:hypothetical protein